MTVYGSCNVNGQQIDRVKKNFIQLLKDVGFLIDVYQFGTTIPFLQLIYLQKFNFIKLKSKHRNLETCNN